MKFRICPVLSRLVLSCPATCLAVLCLCLSLRWSRPVLCLWSRLVYCLTPEFDPFFSQARSALQMRHSKVKLKTNCWQTKDNKNKHQLIMSR